MLWKLSSYLISKVPLLQFSHTRLILRANKKKCCLPSFFVATHSEHETRIRVGVCYHSDQPPHLHLQWMQEEVTRTSPSVL